MEFIWIFFIIAFAIFYKSESLIRKFDDFKLLGLERSKKYSNTQITQESIDLLPLPVQKYLKFVGIIGKNKVYNFKTKITAKMKIDYNKDFVESNIVQYTFDKGLMRIFFMKMNYKGIPIIGFDSFLDGEAKLTMKVLGLFTTAYEKGKKINKAETVTLFNDMCILAPSLLIDANVKWKTLDDYSVEAEFKNDKEVISAILLFNRDYKLINFISNDRYYLKKGEKFKNVKWSTSINNYKIINGYNLPTKYRAYWHFDKKDFCYLKTNIDKIEYNVEY